ncbi:hypothetical protein PENANT_c036G04158 [Penicillium antarcticum]|uniref:Uncharacterized protein n=1 Tax=Penicillium antarcticum TaxID=416450 RepID=A0A1V6PTX0_9EURO|nr:hypothetical protein PENANT_c036G04158 [Penicillium antarcticum]
MELAQAGAYIDPVDNAGSNTLHHAMLFGNLVAAKQLIKTLAVHSPDNLPTELIIT